MNGKIWPSLMLALLMLSSPWAAAQDQLDEAQTVRFYHLANELRCLVCQNQSIADSSAPLAQDLRDQVERQILDGRSDAQIVEYLTARYGDFVLYRPPLRRSTWLLWFGPFVLLLVGLIAALRYARTRRAVATTTATAPDGNDRLRRLLDED